MEDERTTRSLSITSSLETATVPVDQHPIDNLVNPAKRRVLKRKFMELNSSKPLHSKKRRRYNTAKINHLTLTMDRYGVEDRVGAAIASASHQDYGIIDVASKQTDQNLIDKNKIRRAKNRLRFDFNKNLDTTIKGFFSTVEKINRFAFRSRTIHCFKLLGINIWVTLHLILATQSTF